MSEQIEGINFETSNRFFWENKYQTHETGWDLGQVSPPIKSYIDNLENKDIAVLIPGCGNAYEAEYLLQEGFTNVTVIDIAPTLVNLLRTKFQSIKNINIILGDFFEHQEKYDLIIEQTFFCALPPKMRQKYVWKMHQLLKPNGVIAGLLFNRDFEVSPPFGGNLQEYEVLFNSSFIFNSLAVAKNSIPKRQDNEVFSEFQKANNCEVNLYYLENNIAFENTEDLIKKIKEIDEVLNVTLNKDSSEILIISQNEIELENLQNLLSIPYKCKLIKCKK